MAPGTKSKAGGSLAERSSKQIQNIEKRNNYNVRNWIRIRRSGFAQFEL
jgi:hypothetical protein